MNKKFWAFSLLLSASFNVFAELDISQTKKCLLSPFILFSDEDTHHLKKKIPEQFYSLLSKKGYQVLSPEKFKLVRSRNFQHQIVFSLWTFKYQTGVIQFFEPDTKNSLIHLKTWNLDSTQKQFLAENPTSYALKKEIEHLTKLYQSETHATKKVQIKKKINELEEEYEQSLERYDLKHTSMESFYKKVPLCHEVY